MDDAADSTFNADTSLVTDIRGYPWFALAVPPGMPCRTMYTGTLLYCTWYRGVGVY